MNLIDMTRGLFVGLTTLDLIYVIEGFPQSNQKIVAQKQIIAAGGPATNAAIAFAQFGHKTDLLSVIGQHPLTPLIHHDFKQHHVRSLDLNPSWSESPPLSSIFVTQATGERAVVSVNATRSQATPAMLPEYLLVNCQVVLIDGHQMAMGLAIARRARELNVPVVVDGGSWKAGYEDILPYVDYAICSENFQPPGCTDNASVLDYLEGQGIDHIAITHGPDPIELLERGKYAQIPVPSIAAIDTLGAGDIFHGAFCHYILSHSFTEALTQAAAIASFSCQSLGTRAWLKTLALQDQIATD